MCGRRALDGGRYRIDACLGGLPLGQPGAGDLQIADLGDGGPEDAGEGCVTAAQVDPGNPSGLVGHST